MAAHWKNGPELFVLALRRQGLDPDAVDDVARAWSAFQEFVQVPVDGIEPAEDDGDGFIVQWGRWSWHEDRPALVFTRQFAVRNDGDQEGEDDEFWQPQRWNVELALFFAGSPAWADLGHMTWANSMGFDFDPIGHERAAALARIATFIETLPQVSAMWRAIPVGSALGLEPAD
ncbi:hypothetical protein [Streptomyces sp. NBC_01207]|uniref:hypothetical protein n=1 Tax=Streptomyces sp. NBC_01207 TaxID=2903772 RepID=UPI002E158AD0|nr:hypothetical protein OG457_01430 [Streptomyces sp. NBC_01207]